MPETNDHQLEQQTELIIPYNMRYLMDQNLLGTPEFAHVTRLIIDGICPSLIDGPYGQHNRIQFPPRLTYLKYTNSLIDNVPPNLPDTLEELDISGNRISRLTGLPPNLRILNCSGNYMKDLSGIPDSVIHIQCSLNLMTRIAYSHLPSNLNYLICNHCEITELPELPSTLLTLDCANNSSLARLPTLPQTLVSISCCACNLAELPTLPDTMIDLLCDNNVINVLPDELPTALRYLSCESNEITALPSILPSKLRFLRCGHNSITQLPNLPTTLEYLNCDNNLLTWLPELPVALTHLNCSNNKLLVFASVISGAMSELDCSNNPELRWLPPISQNYIYKLRLATLQLSNANSFWDAAITPSDITHVNHVHLKRQYSCASERLAVYRTELLERHVEITMNPDRIARLIRNGELGELGTWHDSLG